MDIKKTSFLKLTAGQNESVIPKFAANINVIANNQNTDNLTLHSCINLVSKSSDTDLSIENIGSTLSDEALEQIYNNANVPTVSHKASEMNFSTTYKDFSPAEISKIKRLIYNIHHPESPIPSDTEEDTDTPSSEKKTFLSGEYENIVDTTTLFEYMNNIDSTITKESGVSRKQLVAFTQKDDFEDSNKDFFGSLNRVFSQIDTDENAVLSFAEIKAFIGNEIGENFEEYSEKVNSYSDQIQSQYAKLSNQRKLEFAIEKTREYLEAAGLTNQIDALDRLLGQQDLYNKIHVGQIAIADLNKGKESSDFKTLGSYTYYSYQISYEHENEQGETETITYNVPIWAQDSDSNSNSDDCGITLDISLLNCKWYELVNTLVHELTHATAYQYYDEEGSGAIYSTVLDRLLQIGALDETEYNYYSENFTSLTEEELNKIYYLLACTWGEYTAYQTDADYNDSIGQDVYHASSDNITTAVNGPQEKPTIENHVEESYNSDTNTEPMPDYKWWSYA